MKNIPCEEIISINFPEHHGDLKLLSTKCLIYVETSAFNFFINSFPEHHQSILNTRALQSNLNKIWMASPVTLWELMLTSNNTDSDRLLLFAQNIFSDFLLATPSEIATRYLNFSYPDNSVKYSFLSDSYLLDTWKKMTKDKSITYKYDKETLKNGTDSIIRKLSKNLKSIVDGEYFGNDKVISSFVNIINTTHSHLISDDFDLPRNNSEITKLTLLFILILMILKIDIDNSSCDIFWRDKGFEGCSIDMLIFFIEKYSRVFWRGPFVEMANMAYYQFKNGIRNRGIIFDSLHMIYMPYINTFITDDLAFKSLKATTNLYSKKIFHTSELNLRIIPFLS